MKPFQIARLVPHVAVGGSATTMNPADKNAALTLSAGDLKVTKSGASGAWATVRGTTSHNSGLWYFEMKRDNAATGDGFILGLATAGLSLSNFPGSAANTIGFIGSNPTRQLYAGGVNVLSSGSGAPSGGYFGIAVNFNTGKVWVRTSNVAGWMGGGNPSTGRLPSATFTPGTALFPAVSLYYNGCEATVNLGASAFNMAAPLGFVGWDSAQPTFSDPYWPHTVFVVSGEGAHGSTTFTDLTGRHTITPTGSIAISTSDGTNFPNGGIDTDGSGSDYLLVTGNREDWVFGTDPFTLEAYVVLDATAAGDGAYMMSNYAGAGTGWALNINTGNGSFRLLRDTATVTRTFAFSNAQLYHLEISRDASGHVRLFVDGNQVGATDTTTLNGVSVGTASWDMVLFAEGPPYTTFGHWNGRQGWARVTAGVARHTANFSPPARPLPTL